MHSMSQHCWKLLRSFARSLRYPEDDYVEHDTNDPEDNILDIVIVFLLFFFFQLDSGHLL